MATSSLHGIAPDQSDSVEEHYVWTHAFGNDARQRLLDEDIAAGRSVGLVLFSVLALGLALGILSVLIATL